MIFGSFYPKRTTQKFFEVGRCFVMFKTPATRPLCLSAAFTFYGGYECHYFKGYKLKNINPLYILSEYLATNILDQRLPFNCVLESRFETFSFIFSIFISVRFFFKSWFKSIVFLTIQRSEYALQFRKSIAKKPTDCIFI